MGRERQRIKAKRGFLCLLIGTKCHGFLVWWQIRTQDESSTQKHKNTNKALADETKNTSCSFLTLRTPAAVISAWEQFDRSAGGKHPCLEAIK